MSPIYPNWAIQSRCACVHSDAPVRQLYLRTFRTVNSFSRMHKGRRRAAGKLVAELNWKSASQVHHRFIMESADGFSGTRHSDRPNTGRPTPPISASLPITEPPDGCTMPFSTRFSQTASPTAIRPPIRSRTIRLPRHASTHLSVGHTAALKAWSRSLLRRRPARHHGSSRPSHPARRQYLYLNPILRRCPATNMMSATTIMSIPISAAIRR